MVIWLTFLWLTIDYELRTMNCLRFAIVDEPRTMNYEPWTTNHQRWTTNYERWTIYLLSIYYTNSYVLCQMKFDKKTLRRRSILDARYWILDSRCCHRERGGLSFRKRLRRSSSAEGFLVQHSQTTNTSHPSFRSFRRFFLSLATFPSRFDCQKSTFVAGFTLP